MRNILKVSGVVIGVLLLLLVAAAVALPLLVEPNDFKPRIVKAVHDATGRKLDIPGDIDLSVFPWLGVQLGTVRLGNAPGFGDTPFASVEGVQVRVKLLPLLRREIEVDRVVVEQPVVRLAKNAAGETNWEGFLAEQPAETAPEEPATEEGAVPEFSIDGIEIRDGHVLYADAASGLNAELSGFHLETGRLGLPADFPLTMRGNIALSEPELGGTFEFKGQVAAAPEEQQYGVTDASLSFKADGKALPASPLEGRLTWQRIAADMAASTTRVEALVMESLGVTLNAALEASNLDETARVQGEIRIEEFSPGRLLVRLGQELPATGDGEVLETASLAVTFRATPDSIVISDLQAALDDSTLAGNVAVTSFKQPAARFELTVDQLDVDRYLPSPADSTTDEAGGKPLDQVEIPAELVQGHDIEGRLAIGRLKAFNFNSTDVTVGILVRNDKLRVHPARATFYGGGYRGDIRLDASGEVPVVSVDEHVKNVQLAPMVKDFAGVENISGTANIGVTATARGRTVGGLRETLAGNFSANVADGAIEGFNLWEAIRKAYATFKRRAYESDAPERTEFAELSASGTISKGILHNDDLLAKLPFLRITGSGDIDIAAATMDYTLEATVVKAPELSGDIAEITDTPIPVHLSGSLTDPKIRPDVKGVLEAKAREALQRKKRELRQEADKKEQELREEAERKAEKERERLEESLKDKLKDFIG